MRAAVFDPTMQAVRNYAMTPTPRAGVTPFLASMGGAPATVTQTTSAADPSPGDSAAHVFTVTGIGGGANLGFNRKWLVEDPSIRPGNQGIALLPGSVIRWRFWIKLPRTDTAFNGYWEGVKLDGSYLGSGPTTRVIDGVSNSTTVVGGKWTQVECAYVVPAGVSGFLLGAGFLRSSDAQIGDVYLLGVCDITIGDLPPAHVDGDLRGGSWSGVAGASRSSCYPWVPQPVRNLSKTPTWARLSAQPFNGNSFTARTGCSGSFEPAGIYGTPCHKATVTTSGIASVHCLGSQAATSPAVAARLTYTAGVFVKTSAPTVLRFVIDWYTTGNIYLSSTIGPSVSVAAGTETRLQTTGTAPDGAMMLWGYWIESSSTSATQLPVGATVLADRSMAVEGSTLPDYGDGSFPGWVWDGVVDASTSRGLPYRLEDIAGDLLATATLPNAAVALSRPLGALEARTLYAVTDALLAVGPGGVGANEYQNVLTLTEGTFNISLGVTLRTGSNGGNARYESRAQYGGAAAFGQTPTGSRTVGRHVLHASQPDGLTIISAGADGSFIGSSASPPLVSTPQATHLRIDNTPIGFSTPPMEATILGLVFAGEHSVDTRRRVVAWLARRYGGTIPAGY